MFKCYLSNGVKRQFSHDACIFSIRRKTIIHSSTVSILVAVCLDSSNFFFFLDYDPFWDMEPFSFFPPIVKWFYTFVENLYINIQQQHRATPSIWWWRHTILFWFLTIPRAPQPASRYSYSLDTGLKQWNWRQKYACFGSGLLFFHHYFHSLESIPESGLGPGKAGGDYGLDSL